MNREVMKQLHLDRRLINRRGWISPDELARELEALPDVSHKVAPEEENSEGAAGAKPPAGVGTGSI